MATKPEVMRIMLRKALGEESYQCYLNLDKDIFSPTVWAVLRPTIKIHNHNWQVQVQHTSSFSDPITFVRLKSIVTCFVADHILEKEMFIKGYSESEAERWANGDRTYFRSPTIEELLLAFASNPKGFEWARRNPGCGNIYGWCRLNRNKTA